MPSSFQGFGTGFVGQRDFWPDGSYVTTEWHIYFFVPLIPIRSVRVKAGTLQTRSLYVIAGTRRDYLICDEQPVNLKQALSVYGFLAFYAVWAYGLLALLRPWMRTLSDSVETTLMLLIVTVPWIVPWYLRLRGKRWRPGFK